MTATTIFICVLLAIVLQLPAQNKDIVGWNGTKWGMKEDDLKSLFGEKLMQTDKKQRTPNGQVLTHKIDSVDIGGHPYSVGFVMDTTGLVRINLKSLDDRIRLKYRFNDLRELLTLKYNAPTFTEDDQKGSKRQIWRFPSSLIELSYTLFTKDPLIAVTHLMYSKNDGKRAKGL